MNPMDIPIPNEIRAASALYILINRRLNNLWLEYTAFIEIHGSRTKTSLVFPVLFGELDFYEILLARVATRLPPEILRELQDEDVSNW